MSVATESNEPNEMQTDASAATVVDERSLKTAPLLKQGRFISPTNQPTLLGHIVISTSLVLSICLSYALMFWFAGTKQNEWLSVTPSLKTEAVNTTIANLTDTKPSEKARLMDQFEQIQDRIKTHANVMGFFYKQYYISLSMICGGSVVASICLFFISKSGWERVNNALINIFIVSSSTVILFGNISLVFEQEENIKGNQALYLSYFALRNEMLSYWATQQASTGDPIAPAKFIHYMDGRLQELSQIRLGFDATRITDLGDQMKQLDGSSQKPGKPNVQK